MPIRINLLAEDQAAQEMRRQDPVKRAIGLAAFLIALFLMWSGWLQVKLGYAAHEQAKYEGQWAKLEKHFTTVTENLQKTAEIESKLSALHQLETNRFLWGMPLSALQHVMIGNIQVTRIKTSQSYALTEEVKPKTSDDGKTTPGKPPTSTEKILLTITAKDLGSPPGLQVNPFKESIAALPYFKDHLKRVDGVHLTELSPPQTDAAEPGKPFVLLTLDCIYPEKTRSK
jgi:hypothetical protein